jgi:solute carrier family 25 ornithine transporter 2/15
VCQKFVAQTFEKKSNVGEISLLGNATAGFLAAFFSSFTLCPTELIKCKLQAQHEMKQTTRISAYQLTRQILKTEGIQGMFRGLTPTFAREMPGYFFFFGGYELARENLAK